MNGFQSSHPIYIPLMKRLRLLGPRLAMLFWGVTLLTASGILYYAGA